MRPVVVLLIRFDAAGDGFGAQLAVPLGQRQHLVATEFDGPGLVHGDVAGLGSHHPLPGAQQRVDHRGVGLCAADEEINGSLRGVAGGANLFPRTLGVFVQSVAHGVFHIGLRQPFHYGGVGPLHVVGGEEQFIGHDMIPPA